ncbi:hypothetical protein PYY25_001989 [Campylobacter coli]|nr:hypothetical protein [Campylobacter coli]EAI3152791.1 hypothetical protein [Campylobacter coli]EAI3152797.1 hypothetical protein [Campylobacter coli]EAI3152803.1 hypothetical protein [Campylobacter coli]EAI3152809.1 hypothetical protein [Campylobacter coli]
MPEKGKTFAGEVREETVAWSKDTYQLLKQAEQGKVKSYVQDIALVFYIIFTLILYNLVNTKKGKK